MKHPDADRLARELARRRHMPVDEVVVEILRNELEKQPEPGPTPGLAERLMELGRRNAALPIVDRRTEEEFLGYDDMMNHHHG